MQPTVFHGQLGDISGALKNLSEPQTFCTAAHSPCVMDVVRHAREDLPSLRLPCSVWLGVACQIPYRRPSEIRISSEQQVIVSIRIYPTFCMRCTYVKKRICCMAEI